MDKNTIGHETSWLDDLAVDINFQDTVLSPEAQQLAGSGVPQDAEYMLANDAPVINNDHEHEEHLNDSKLMEDQNWIQASKIAYKFFTGDKDGIKKTKQVVPDVVQNANSPMGTDYNPAFHTQMQQMKTVNAPMTDKDYAEWGLEFMGMFNWNLPVMGISAGQLKFGDLSPDATPYGNPAFATYVMMDMYDKLPNWTWNGTKRMAKGLISDPSTYAGLYTLGLGFFAKHSAKSAGKSAIKNHLKKLISPTALVAYEGGMYSGADNALRQSVKLMSNNQSSFDWGSFGQSVVVGMTLGGAVAGGANNLYRILPSQRAINKLYKTADEAQAGLVQFLKQATVQKKVITDLEASDVINPGIKEKQTTVEKVKRKGYETARLPEKLTDIVRTGVIVGDPKESDEMVELIANSGAFKIVENEGWQAYPGGYFDRKIVVETPQGNLAEVQFWSKGIAKIKDNMHEIYQTARKIEPSVKNNTASKDELNTYHQSLIESDKLATEALISDLAGWQDIYTQIGLDVEPYLQIAGRVAGGT